MLEVCDFDNNEEASTSKEIESLRKQNTAVSRKNAQDSDAKESVKATESAATRLKNLREFVAKESSAENADVPDRLKNLQTFVTNESDDFSESDYDDDRTDDEIYNDDEEETGSLKRKGDESDLEPSKKKLSEDIYGRLRDEEGNIVEVK